MGKDSPTGADTHHRADFVRGRDGQVEWYRLAGRPLPHQPAPSGGAAPHADLP